MLKNLKIWYHNLVVRKTIRLAVKLSGGWDSRKVSSVVLSNTERLEIISNLLENEGLPENSTVITIGQPLKPNLIDCHPNSGWCVVNYWNARKYIIIPVLEAGRYIGSICYSRTLESDHSIM